jgi:hypothetical protein
MDFNHLFFLVFIGTSVWVLVDAKTIGVKKSDKKALFNMGPTGWFFACLLLWIIAFPAYIAKRAEYRRLSVAQSGEKQAMPPGPHTAESKKKGRWWLSWMIAGIAVLIGFGLVEIFSAVSALGINGLPKCDSTLAKNTAKMAIANGPLSKIVNLEIISFEHVENAIRVNADDDKTFCKADVLTNAGRQVMYYTISQTSDGNFYVSVSLEP